MSNSKALILGLFAMLLADLAQALCGDGVLDTGEACDDGNTALGDGCAVDCAFEPLCVVTNGNGDASSMAVTADGQVSPVVDLLSLAGAGVAGGRDEVARCGRFVYLLRDGDIHGLEVALDGQLTELPVAIEGSYHGISCDEGSGLLFGRYNPGNSLGLTSFVVDATGSLAMADDLELAPFVIFTAYATAADLHPLADSLFVLVYMDLPLASPVTVSLRRISYDASGNLTSEEGTLLNPEPFLEQARTIGDVRFASDASFLALPGLEFGSKCFGYFNDPGTTVPPVSELKASCPFGLDNYRSFEPRSDGEPIFYYQGDAFALRTGVLGATAVRLRASITPVHNTRQLLLAFGGRVLLSLAEGEVASYDVAPDLETLSVNDEEATGISHRAGVLLPCPGLADTDGDGASDPDDNCVLVANQDQRDTNQDGSGNACDPDLNDDGVVGIPDFNAFRAVFGLDADDPGYDEDADFTGDGAIGLPDFNVLREYFGSPPGP